MPAPTPKEGTFRLASSPTAIAFLCVAVAFAVYGPALSNQFVNEDALLLNDGLALVQDPRRLPEIRPLGYFRPIWSSWIALFVGAFGTEPRPFFVAGILLHAGAGWCLWRLARRIAGGTTTPLVAALSFLCFYAQCEAVLWMSAQNTALVVLLTIVAVELHLRAVERGGARDGAWTALAAGAALFTKESAVVLFAWLPLAEALVHGPRSLFTRRSLVRALWLALPAIAFLVANDRVVSALLAPLGLEDVPSRASRAHLGNTRFERVAGTLAWLASPATHVGQESSPLAGGALAAGAAVLTALLARRLLRPAILALLLAATALYPAAITSLQTPSPCRIWYGPTVGAALALGLLVASVVERARAHGAGRPATAACAVVLAVFLVLHARSVRFANERYYEPQAFHQTAMARALGAYRPSPGGSRTILLLEPPLENVGHLRNFLRLYHGIPPASVQPAHVRLDAASDWLLDEGARNPDWSFLLWDMDAAAFVAADRIPERTAPHFAESLGYPLDRPERTQITVYRIEWAAPR